jgi:hypothetical protein
MVFVLSPALTEQKQQKLACLEVTHRPMRVRKL